MRRYHVTTFGCQMNEHDSERIRGMLEDLGYGEAGGIDDADVVVFNTCTVREKPDQRLYSQLNHVKYRKKTRPDSVVAVGGCLVEAQQDMLFREFPWVDVAFGPGHIDKLGEYLVSSGDQAHVGYYGIGDDRSFAAELPARRERRHQAWLQISMGCNSVCAYCIVPRVRGRETSRTHHDILQEIERLAGDGVTEVTLLGQNVNSYGRDLPPDDRLTFAQLLRSVDAIDGIERIRFTSPHPKDMREDVIAAMAESPAVCEQLHLPLQSGSSKILKSMRRTYDRDRFVALAGRIREAIPDIAFSTDVIVGFPGETEEDFEQTLEVVREVRFDSAFTFIFSTRAGTEAASMEDQVPDEVKAERLSRLVEVVREVGAERMQRHVGTTQQVLVEGTSRTDDTRLRGRTRHNVVANFQGDAAAGEYVDVVIESATSQTLAGSQLPAGVAG